MNYIEYDNSYGSFKNFIATVMTIQIYYCLNEHPESKVNKMTTHIDDNKMTLSLGIVLDDNDYAYTTSYLSIKDVTKYQDDDIHKDLIHSGLMIAIKPEYNNKYLDIDKVKELSPDLYPIIESITNECIEYGLISE